MSPAAGGRAGVAVHLQGPLCMPFRGEKRREGGGGCRSGVHDSHFSQYQMLLHSQLVEESIFQAVDATSIADCPCKTERVITMSMLPSACSSCILSMTGLEHKISFENRSTHSAFRTVTKFGIARLSGEALRQDIACIMPLIMSMTVDICKLQELNDWRWHESMTNGTGLAKEHWRKSSQWFSLLRHHAEMAATDWAVNEAFATHCYFGPDHEDARSSLLLMFSSLAPFHGHIHVIDTSPVIALTSSMSKEQPLESLGLIWSMAVLCCRFEIVILCISALRSKREGPLTLGLPICSQTDRSCVSDEHYIPTLLAFKNESRNTDCRGEMMRVTWPGTVPHPVSWTPADISADLCDLCFF